MRFDCKFKTPPHQLMRERRWDSWPITRSTQIIRRCAHLKQQITHDDMRRIILLLKWPRRGSKNWCVYPIWSAAYIYKCATWERATHKTIVSLCAHSQTVRGFGLCCIYIMLRGINWEKVIETNEHPPFHVISFIEQLPTPKVPVEIKMME